MFIATCIVLTLASAALYFGRWDTATKLRWGRRQIVLSGVLFVIYLTLLGTPVPVLLVVVPFVVAITVFNIRRLRFCERCGREVQIPNTFRRSAFCSRCGARVPR